MPLDFRLAWAFIDMMKTDTYATASAAAARVNDGRLRAFHDPSQQLGHSMARTLGWKHHLAWDTYFIYPAGVAWTERDLPTPQVWYHQLQDREVWAQVAEAQVGTADWVSALAEKSEADPAHFATGEALRAALTAGIHHARSND